MGQGSLEHTQGEAQEQHWPSPFKGTHMKNNRRKKIDLFSREESVLANTICELLGTSPIAPLSMRYLMDCFVKLPFSVSIYFDKIYGRYLVSNQHMDDWKDETLDSTFCGANFTVIDTSLEMAMARAVHYYFHWNERREMK